MADWVRKFLYRIFCVMALMVSVYLIVDFLISRHSIQIPVEAAAAARRSLLQHIFCPS